MDKTDKLFKVLLNDSEAFYIKLENETFAVFKENIFKRKPNFKEKNLRIFWIDGDQDEIIVNCDEDFKICLEDKTIKKIFVQTVSKDLKRHKGSKEEYRKKMKAAHHLLDSDSNTQGTDLTSDSSDSASEYTFTPKKSVEVKIPSKPKDTSITSTSEPANTSKDSGIKILKLVNVNTDFSLLDENFMESAFGVPKSPKPPMAADDVMIVDDEEGATPAISTAPSTSGEDLRSDSLVISDSDGEGFVEKKKETEKLPRSSQYSFTSRNIPENIYHPRTTEPSGPRTEKARPRTTYSHHFQRRGDRGFYTDFSSNRRPTVDSGRFYDMNSNNLPNLFSGVQTMVSSISSTVNDNLRRNMFYPRPN